MTCAHKCVEPDTCVSGCICPYGTVENENGECVSTESCKCMYGNVSYLNGEYIIDETNCRKWYFYFIEWFNIRCNKKNLLKIKRLCQFGCLIEQNYKCTCDWSEWTEWGNCSQQCYNGTQSRYRNKYCDSSMESETRTCSDTCIQNCYDSLRNSTYIVNEIISEDRCKIR